MTATTSERNTQSRDGVDFSLPVAASTHLYAGTIVCVDTSGNAVAGATSTTQVAVGVALESADNSSGSAGDINVPVRRGVYQFANSTSTDEINAADYGDDAYIVDNQTVAKTSGSSTRSVAGKVRAVDDNGVWVEF